MSYAAPPPSLPRWKPTGVEKAPVRSDPASLLARAHTHQKARDFLPARAVRFFEIIALGCRVGPHSPAGVFRRRRKRNRTFGSLLHRPAFASRASFVKFMVSVIHPRVDHQRTALSCVEPEPLDRRHARLFEDRPLAPGLAAIRRNQQKWIARRTLQIRPRDPAVLKIDELNLIQPGEPDSRIGFRPALDRKSTR